MCQSIYLYLFFIFIFANGTSLGRTVALHEPINLGSFASHKYLGLTCLCTEPRRRVRDAKNFPWFHMLIIVHENEPSYEYTLSTYVSNPKLSLMYN